MATDTPVREQDKFMLRLPDGMRDRLKAEAEANKRSMNAEIVERLEQSLDPSAMPQTVQEFMHKYIESYLIMQTDQMIYFVLDAFDKMKVSEELRSEILARAPPRMLRSAEERMEKQKFVEETNAEVANAIEQGRRVKS